MVFKQYRRTAIAEMAKWSPKSGLKTLKDLQEAGISVSQADIINGSPKPGDMIARNPNNHADMWLVAKEYAEANFVKYQ